MSVEFAELTALQEAERWDNVAKLLADAARGLEAAGADLLLMCTTFHRVAEQVAAAVSMPLLHLADVVAEAAKERGLTTVGLLGTAFTRAAASSPTGSPRTACRWWSPRSVTTPR